MPVELDIDSVDWGNCLCAAPPCTSLAEALYEGVPYCLDCAELLIERQVAIAAAPSLRVTLPPVFER